MNTDNDEIDVRSVGRTEFGGRSEGIGLLGSSLHASTSAPAADEDVFAAFVQAYGLGRQPSAALGSRGGPEGDGNEGDGDVGEAFDLDAMLQQSWGKPLAASRKATASTAGEKAGAHAFKHFLREG